MTPKSIDTRGTRISVMFRRLAMPLWRSFPKYRNTHEARWKNRK
jgi:hypothetical protein